jgi:hypothetical protein
MRKTVRILFANCPRLDDAACAYLLLAQNKIQRVFQFEVYHLFVQSACGEVASDVLTDILGRYGVCLSGFRFPGLPIGDTEPD